MLFQVRFSGVNMQNKCVLITGATVNTGLECAKTFLSQGYTVFITSRNQKNAQKTAQQLSKEYNQKCFGWGFSPLHAKEQVEELYKNIEKLGYAVDVVVCNAADLGLDQDVLNVDIDEWNNVLVTNVTGYFATAKQGAKQMISSGKNKNASIVLVGSINYKNAIPNRSAYVASKGAILSLTKALALDFAPYGIRVNCVMPGPIWTTRYDADPQKAIKKAQPVPMGRVSTTKEIAQAIFYFATNQSGNATGTGLIIDGGLDCSCACEHAFI